MKIIVRENGTGHRCITACDMVEYEPASDRLYVRQADLNGTVKSVMIIEKARTAGRENDSGSEAASRIMDDLNSREYCKIVCDMFKVYI